MLALGIDSGTQSTKVLAVDLDTGTLLASARSAHRMVPGLPEGHIEQEPQMWYEAMCEAVRSCLDQLGPRREEVLAIGVSGQQHGCVVLDENDHPIRPAKLWCDTSTQAQCETITEAFGGAGGVIELAGNPILPGYTLPKLLWLKENEPNHFRRIRSILLPHDYLNFRLTGEKKMEYGDASGTGALNIRTRSWSVPLLDYVSPTLKACLPTPGSSRLPNGLLREELRESWGLRHRPVVSAGGGDNMLGAIGTGNVSEGRVTASLGTSGTLYAWSPTPVIDPRGEVAAFCDSTNGWLPLACTMNVTVATEELRALFHWDLAELEAAAASAAPGADGVLFLPYLQGERTPNLPNASALFHGLRIGKMTRENLARAVMEGATLGMAYGLARLRELGITPTEIRLTGGGSASPLWRQICADTFNVPTVGLASPDGAALGAAIQAGVTALSVRGELVNLQEMVERNVALDESTRTMPQPENAALYEEALARFSALSHQLHQGGFL